MSGVNSLTWPETLNSYEMISGGTVRLGDDETLYWGNNVAASVSGEGVGHVYCGNSAGGIAGNTFVEFKDLNLTSNTQIYGGSESGTITGVSNMRLDGVITVGKVFKVFGGGGSTSYIDAANLTVNGTFMVGSTAGSLLELYGGALGVTAGGGVVGATGNTGTAVVMNVGGTIRNEITGVNIYAGGSKNSVVNGNAVINLSCDIDVATDALVYAAVSQSTFNGNLEVNISGDFKFAGASLTIGAGAGTFNGESCTVNISGVDNDSKLVQSSGEMTIAGIKNKETVVNVSDYSADTFDFIIGGASKYVSKLNFYNAQTTLTNSVLNYASWSAVQIYLDEKSDITFSADQTEFYSVSGGGTVTLLGNELGSLQDFNGVIKALDGVETAASFVSGDIKVDSGTLTSSAKWKNFTGSISCREGAEVIVSVLMNNSSFPTDINVNTAKGYYGRIIFNGTTSTASPKNFNIANGMLVLTKNVNILGSTFTGKGMFALENDGTSAANVKIDGDVSGFTGCFSVSSVSADNAAVLTFTGGNLAGFAGSFNWGEYGSFDFTDSGLGRFLIGGGTKTFAELESFMASSVTGYAGTAYGSAAGGVLHFTASNAEAVKLEGDGKILIDNGVSVNADVSGFTGKLCFSVGDGEIAAQELLAGYSGEADIYLSVGGNEFELLENSGVVYNGYIYTLSNASGTLTLNAASIAGGESVEHYFGSSSGTVTLDGKVSVSGNVYAGGAQLRTGDAVCNVSDGVYNQIFGGGKLIGHNGSENGNVSVNISGGTANRVFGGSAVLEGSEVHAANSNLSLSGAMTSGGTSGVWNYGAGVVSQGGYLSAGTSTVTASGSVGSVGNVVGGGRVEISGEIKVDTVALSIDNSEADSVFGGVYFNRGGNGSVSSITGSVSASASVINVFGGGALVNAGTLSVEKSEFTVSGKVTNAVFGGSYLVSGGEAVVNNTVLNIETSAANGIYGGGYVSGDGKDTVVNANINLISGNINCCVFGGGFATGGNSTVNSVAITVSSSADAAAIYCGGFASGGTVTVDKANVIFDGVSPFAGTVYAGGYGANSSVGFAELTLNSYSGSFNGSLSGVFDMVSIDVASSAVFSQAIAGNLKESGLVNVTGEAAGGSHDIFDLADAEFDISRIAVDGSSLTELSDWGTLTVAYGYNAQECKFAVIQYADREAAEWSNYSLYTLA